MSTFERACEIAAQAHASQTDKQGQPYINHPLRVANAVDGRLEQIVAILHDVVEDTKITLNDLRSEGFDEKAIVALDCLTRRRGETYGEFILRCKTDPIATTVKLADLEDNSRIDRAILRPGKIGADMARLFRYFLSHQFLRGDLDEATYRSLMEHQRRNP